MGKSIRPGRVRPLMLAAAILSATVAPARASDHLDTPAVIADPRADIGDLFAWISPDGSELDLVMTIVGHSFSDKLSYVFHIESGSRFGRTSASTVLVCRFASATAADCRLGGGDRARGDASKPTGLVSGRGHFRVFAGLRDDPFFNNVRGTRDVYNVAIAALASGARYDASGCPGFSAAQSADILRHWKRTDGGLPTNFLRGWTPDSIVVSIKLAAVTRGGAMLAIWGATVGPKGQIDRAARPLTGNALLATLGTAEESNRLKERYNESTPATSASFVSAIAQGIALYDGFDGRCGDSLLIDRKAPPPQRYWPLARLLADDRLWLNSRSAVCTQLFAVERAALNGEKALANDCGGRTINYDAVNVYRSLLADGSTTMIDDGVHADDKVHSTAIFPFLAAPDAVPAGK